MFIQFKSVLVSILVPSITPLNLASLMNSDSNSSLVNTPSPMTTAVYYFKFYTYDLEMFSINTCLCIIL